jgi:hypothetical protein
VTDPIAPITQVAPQEAANLLNKKYVRNTLMGTLSDALRKVAGTDEAVFYGAPLKESQINNLRTTMQRQDMRISVHRVRRGNVDGHLIRAEYIHPQHEEADL